MKSGNHKSVMSHNFSQVPKAEIERSSFNRSHGLKTTFNSGLLVPVFVDEALPGDTYNVKMNTFARLSTPLVPIMDNLFIDSFFFAVPIRLLWNNWQKFNGEQINPGDSTDYLVPQMVAPAGGYAENTPIVRDLAIRCIHAPMCSIFSGFRWTDTTQGFRAYSRKLLLHDGVRPFRAIFRRYELLAFLSVCAPKLGLRCLEIGTKRRYPKGVKAPTKISKISGNWAVFATLLRACCGAYAVRNRARG
ncbi:MAG: hypothetical protein EOO38_15675 [Cytophagaceae bacterium]|nr:MAG: hypothetical protein EOO38_15675 [Cytophagaceae bacterium]